MGELASSIAHEVNQPISGIVVDANTCLRWLAGDPPNLDEARETARRIARDGLRGLLLLPAGPDVSIAWEFAAPDAGSTMEAAQEATVSRDLAPLRADHQAPPAAPEVSRFSLGERTTLLERETERGAIRALIDRALTATVRW